MIDQRDSRSWLSVGIAWASRITTLALEFAVPVLIGVGLDRWWGTSPGATIAGAVLGLCFSCSTRSGSRKNCPPRRVVRCLGRERTPRRPEEDKTDRHDADQSFSLDGRSDRRFCPTRKTTLCTFLNR